MRLPRTRLTILSLPSLAYSLSFNCKEVAVGKDILNLEPLGGPHSVHLIEEGPTVVTNWTFTLDVCKPLRKSKHVPDKAECPNGTRVCGIKYVTNVVFNTTQPEDVVPIAGEFSNSNGRALDPVVEPFKGSGSHHNAEKDGFTLTLNGGLYPFNDRKGMQQKAIIEFQCDDSTDGLAGDEPGGREKEPSEDEAERRDIRVRKDDDDDDDDDDDEKKHVDKSGKDLRFVSYKHEKDNVKILRLDWRTKHACPGKRSNGGSASKGGYGFFGSFIIILFLAIAAYLIFGSWLNYNRYGARGWDLVPHGDTIRDIPYLMKDWGRRVVNTVQGPGSRGGYSAV